MPETNPIPRFLYSCIAWTDTRNAFPWRLTNSNSSSAVLQHAVTIFSPPVRTICIPSGITRTWSNDSRTCLPLCAAQTSEVSLRLHSVSTPSLSNASWHFCHLPFLQKSSTVIEAGRYHAWPLELTRTLSADCRKTTIRFTWSFLSNPIEQTPDLQIQRFSGTLTSLPLDNTASNSSSQIPSFSSSFDFIFDDSACWLHGYGFPSASTTSGSHSRSKSSTSGILSTSSGFSKRPTDV